MSTRTVFRRLVVLAMGACGLVAIAAEPASAGIILPNHCHPAPVTGVAGAGT